MLAHLLAAHARAVAKDVPDEALAVARKAVELAPESVAREHFVMPLAVEGETLVLASADAGNVMLADKLRFIFNKDVRFVSAPRARLIVTPARVRWAE